VCAYVHVCGHVMQVCRKCVLLCLHLFKRHILVRTQDAHARTDWECVNMLVIF